MASAPLSLEPPSPYLAVRVLRALGRDALVYLLLFLAVRLALEIEFLRAPVRPALPEEIGLLAMWALGLFILIEALVRFVRYARKPPYPSMRGLLLVLRALLIFPLVFPIQLAYSVLVRTGAIALAFALPLLGFGLPAPAEGPFTAPAHWVWWWFLALLAAAGAGLAYAGWHVFRAAKLHRFAADTARRLAPSPCAGEHGAMILVAGRAGRAPDDQPSLEDASVLLRYDAKNPAKSRCRPFVVADESGETLVDPGTDPRILSSALWVTPEGVPRPDVEILREGEPVWVLGHPVEIREGANSGPSRWRIEPVRPFLWEWSLAPEGFEPWECRALRWGRSTEPVLRIGAPPCRPEALPSARGAWPRLALAAVCFLLASGLVTFAARGFWGEWRVGQLIERLRPGDRPVDVTPAVEALADAYAPVRIQAAYALASNTAPHPQAVPMLLKALDDPHRIVRRCAIHALGERRVVEAIPALLRAGVSGEKARFFPFLERDLRYPVLMALEHHDVRNVAPFQQDNSLSFLERVLALELLACRGDAGKGYIHVPLVLEALASPDSYIRWVGDCAHEDLDPLDPELARGLLQRLKKAKGDALIELLSNSRWDRVESSDAVRELARIVREGPFEPRLRALHALRRMGSQAAEALPEITACVNDATHESAWEAMNVIRMLGPNAADSTGALVGVILSPRYSLHDAAVETLLGIGPAARSLVEAARLDAAPASLSRLDQVLLKLPAPPTLRPGQPLEAEPLPAEAANTLALEGELLFDGKPLTDLTPAAPQVQLYDRTQARWLRQEPVVEGHRFRFDALAPGEYQVNASVDRLPGGGSTGPEDLWSYATVTLKREGNTPLTMNLQQGIRLLEPADTGEPVRVYPKLGPRVRFAWKPVAPGVRYTLGLHNQSLGTGRSEKTEECHLTLDLDPGNYQLRLYADRDGKRLGALRVPTAQNQYSVEQWNFSIQYAEGEPRDVAVQLMYAARPCAYLPACPLVVKLTDRVSNKPVEVAHELDGARLILKNLPTSVYGLHVEVRLPNDDPQGPGSTLEGSLVFLAKPGGPQPMLVPLTRTIYLDAPEDTRKHVLAHLPPLQRPPILNSPVTIRWTGLGEGIEYHYHLHGPKYLVGKVKETSLTFDLPHGVYRFSLQALQDGHHLGRLRVTGPQYEGPLYTFNVAP